MRLIPKIGEPLTRSLVLLAPEGEELGQFQSVVFDRSLHRHVLDGIQRLRAAVYTADGAVGIL